MSGELRPELQALKERLARTLDEGREEARARRHAKGYRTSYSHLSQVFVEAGNKIGRGAALGRVGNSGRSTPPSRAAGVNRWRLPMNRRSSDRRLRCRKLRGNWRSSFCWPIANNR